MKVDDATAADDTGCATPLTRAPECEEAIRTTKTSDDDLDHEGRDCNDLESIFLTFNVRFVVGMTLPPEVAATTRRRRRRRRAEEVSEAFATSLAVHGADVEAVVVSPPPPTTAVDGDAVNAGNRSSPNHLSPHPRLRVRGRDGDGYPFDVVSFRDYGCCLRQAVNDNVRRDLPADGPPSLTLYTSTSEEVGADDEDGGGDRADAVVAIVVNINHALFDAITMRAVLRTLLWLLEENHPGNEQEEGFGERSPSSAVEARPCHVALEWGDLVRTYPPPNPSETPRYLPMPYSNPEERPLKMSEVIGGGPDGLLSGNDDDDPSDVVVTIDPETFRRCRTACQARSTTLTGLWMSCLSHAIAEAYFRNLSMTDAPSDGSAALRPCRVAISVLVDLRRFFPEEERNVLQVQSTVTVGVELSPRDVANPSEDDSLDCGKPGRRTAVALLERAKAMTSDLRARIDRGEAHRQADAFSSGRSDDGCPVEATVEFSNHGVYRTRPPDVAGEGRGRTAGCEVEVTQRFDGYGGMAVVVYSESGSDAMKAVGSLGEDVCRSGAVALMNRVQGLFELVSRFLDKASTE